MDNITHGLFGYALARALPAARHDADRQRRVAVWASVLGSNAPDLDLVAQWFASDPKLNYLLQHRGHTHTLLWALPLGALVGGLCALGHRMWRPAQWSAAAAVGALAALLHIGFDALNNYGVHPFAPFDGHWYYGDAVFIVEPLLWIAMLPLPALAGLTRAGRGLGWLLTGLLTALLLVAPMPSMPGAALVGVLALALGVSWRCRPTGRATLCIVAGLLLAQFGASHAAAKTARAGLATAFPTERVLDLIRSPHPGNPLCWSALAVTLDDARTYRVRRGHVGLWPALWTGSECTWGHDDDRTAPTVADGPQPSAQLALSSAFVAPASELRALSDANCRARAALHFMRAPFWTGTGPGALIGDMRFDNEPAAGFSELPLDGQCPESLPPWVPPRAADVLRAR